jgi:hypothetical protein
MYPRDQTNEEIAKQLLDDYQKYLSDPGLNSLIQDHQNHHPGGNHVRDESNQQVEETLVNDLYHLENEQSSSGNSNSLQAPVHKHERLHKGMHPCDNLRS